MENAKGAKRMKVKKILSIFLAIAMVISLMSGITIPARATEGVWDRTISISLSGSGTQDTPFLISSGADLAYMAQEVNSGGTISGVAASSAYYKLTCDIVLNENALDYESWGISAPANSWTPIGDDSPMFLGSFDGDGHTVSGIYINTETTTVNYRGLFGYVSGGTVKNVGVKDSYIKGQIYVAGVVALCGTGTVQNCYNTGSVTGNNSLSFVGGVTGYNSGTVSNCYNTGSVSATGSAGGIAGNNNGGTVQDCYNTGSVSGASYTGGVAGKSTGTVSNCHNSGSVSGSNSENGGVVGINDTNGILQNCYNTGSVSGLSFIGGMAGTNKGTLQYCYNIGSVSSSNNIVGGLIASNTGTLQYCYNAGSVSGTTMIGGIVGYNYSPSPNTISECYNTGSVSGTSSVGGLIGFNDTGTVTRCYYDKQMCAAGGINGSDTANAVGKSTSEMTESTTFSSWDSSKWTFASGIYPRLIGMDTTDAAYVSASPIFLTSSQTVASVTSDFTVSTANGVSWDSGDTSVVSISGGLSNTDATLAGSGSVALTATKVGASKTVALTSSYTPTYTVSGTVLQVTTGAPVNNLIVTLYSSGTATSHTGTTNASGNFEITGVPDGTYTAVIAGSSRNGRSTAALTVDGDNFTGADITLTAPEAADYIITNNMDGKFLVDSGPIEYNTLATALNACTNYGEDGVMTIQLGSSATPLVVTGVTSEDSLNNTLIGATYTGNVRINYTGSTSGKGLYINSDTVFDGLTVTTQLTNESVIFQTINVNNGTLDVKNGTSIINSSDWGYCVYMERGTFNILEGTVTGASGLYSSVSNTTGAININGGTIDANGAGGYAVSSAAAPITMTGGTVQATDTGSDFFSYGIRVSSGTDATISGGTITCLGTNSYSAAICSTISSGDNSVVAVSGGAQIISATANTICISQHSRAVDTQNAVLFGKTVHGSIDGDVSVMGAASGNLYVVNSSNFANSVLIASNMLTGKSFDAWTSDPVFTFEISEINGDTVSSLTTGANDSVTDIYLKTGTETVVVLATGSLGTEGDSSITGLTAGTTYKVIMGSVTYYVKADGTLSLRSSDAADLIGTEITGLVNGTTYKVEVYSNLPLDAWSGDYTSVLETGSYGTGDGQLAEPEGTAVDSTGNIYVVDRKNNRVVKYNSSGAYQSSFGSSGSGNGEFNRPYGIAIDSQNNVYILDSGNQRVQKFDSSGAYLAKFSTGITTTYAMYIAVDSSDNIYITETTTKKVFKYNSAGEFQSEISVIQTNSHIRGIAVDSAGNIYVGADDYKIYKYSADGTFVSSFGEGGSEQGKLNGIKGLKTDSEDNIWVADTANNRISVFSNTGGFIRTIGSRGHDAGELRYAQELWITDDGTVYVADTGNYRIQKFEKRPYISNTGYDSITISATAKQAEDIYWVVLPAAANAPTNEQVMAGTDAAGNALANSLKGSASAAAGEVKTISVTGLTPNTPYSVYLMAADGTGTKSVTVKLSTTTDFHVTAPTGTGTNADPYIIDSPEDLLWLSRQCAAGNTSAGSAYYRQTADIDMSAVTNFVPIGTESSNSRFTGNYDGGNYKITNLNITDSGVKFAESYYGYYGLFGYTQGAVIKNIVMQDITIDISLGQDDGNSEMVYCYAGGIAGWASDSKITNCRVLASGVGSSTIDVTAITGRTILSAGGIAGMVDYSDNPENAIVVEKCRSEVSITGSINKGRDSYFGGIVGWHNTYPSGAKLQNCYNTGSISVSGTLDSYRSVSIGGIVGYLYKASVLNCYSTGSLTDTTTPGAEYSYQYKGGIVGSTNGNVTGCYFLDATATNGIGSLSGTASDTGAAPKTDAQLKTPSTYTNWNTAVWEITSAAYPVFRLTTAYSVFYNANGSTSGTVPIDSSTYDEGATVTVLANSGTLSKTGYTFAGWNTAADGTGTDYAAAATFAMGTNNVTLYAKWSQSGGGGNGGSSGGSSSSSNNASVIVGGQTQTAGTVSTTTSGGTTTTTVTIDADDIADILADAGRSATITIPITTGADTAVGRLDGQAVKNMENKDAVIVVDTGSASYTLPASEINIDAISAQFGENVSLADITVNVAISGPSDATVTIVENAAEEGNFSLVVPAVEFTVSCTYNGRTVEVSTFNSYVERLIAIPDGVDPSKITTGIVVEPDGSIHHVPTEVVIIDGKYFAKINSLTNSVYSVIWNPIEFSDVENHWAKGAINNMGSRLVVNGVGNNSYDPDRSITRAEFAAIMVKALGLEPGTGTNSFSDVASTDWFCKYVETASTYGIINGYSADTFGPNDTITREQAMAMIARAMKITGLGVSLSDRETSSLLAAYTDGASAADYAKGSIAACLKAGIVSGTSENTIAPQDYVTRAEVAVMAERLLEKSELI